MPKLSVQKSKQTNILEKAAAVSDLGLVDIHRSLDFLFQITPVNVDEEWKKFEQKGFDAVPHFRYHPKSKKLSSLRQKLNNLPVEKISDPIVRRIFREKSEELGRKIEMLSALESPVFLDGSLEIYHPPNDDLGQISKDILKNIRFAEASSVDQPVDSDAFAKMARQEIQYYLRQAPELKTDVSIRSDFSDLMVSNGRLLIGKKLKLSISSAQALIQHEVGTHLLTFWNGSQQPLHLLGAGFAGYEELQEGLAVVSEYLTGGLDPQRLRVLAGRVIAVRSLVDGAVFLDSFRLLHQTHGFDARNAFLIAARVHRAGGLTKDAIYLRGFLKLIEFLKKSGPFDVLWMGKIALNHVLLIQDLLRRGILTEPRFKPRYLETATGAEKLRRLSESSFTIGSLIEEVRRKCRK